MAVTLFATFSVTRCLLDIWPFTAKQIGPKQTEFSKVGSKFGKIQFKHSKSCPNIFNILPKWQNVAKSGHTVLATF